MTLSFGKHKGKDLTEVPYDYLVWLEQQDWIGDDLREVLVYEFGRRANPGLGRVVKR